MSGPAIPERDRIVAHKYEQVDYEIIWNALAHRLPTEAERIRHIMVDG
jgi:uncharacterized protein with HEPN domain